MPNVKDKTSTQNHWQLLVNLYKKYRSSSIKQLNEDNPQRQSKWLLEAAGLKVDLSRSFINKEIHTALIDLAQGQGLEDNIKALLDGEAINNTEDRAAHHTALRDSSPNNNRPEVAAAQLKIEQLANDLRSQTWRGSADQIITDVVNIGIGGSDLGPRMVCGALANYCHGGPNVHFVANIDPRDLEQTLEALNPANTLIVISSKSFSTTETLENALSARKWLLNSIPAENIGRHVIAVSSNIDKAVEFGVDAENILPMWDWVGGRYSLWSAIGLPIAIAIGYQGFKQLLDGANAMDQHFATAPLEKNLPATLALLEIWYVNFCNANSAAVLPYSHELRMFPDYLQQLTMESNGKQVSKDGEPISVRTCPTIWGSAGTIGQHSFHQLLHQGSELIPVDFILPLHSHSDELNKQAHLVANCLAQSKALTEGKTREQALQEMLDSGTPQAQAESLAPHKTVAGNRPNTIIVMDKLTPENLGALIALYEHKVFVESVVWEINAFDQWGVELGKQLSTPIFAALTGTKKQATDKTTEFWVNAFTQG